MLNEVMFGHSLPILTKIWKSRNPYLSSWNTAVTLIPTINDQDMDLWTFIFCTFKYFFNEFFKTYHLHFYLPCIFPLIYDLSDPDNFPLKTGGESTYDVGLIEVWMQSLWGKIYQQRHLKVFLYKLKWWTMTFEPVLQR